MKKECIFWHMEVIVYFICCENMQLLGGKNRKQNRYRSSDQLQYFIGIPKNGAKKENQRNKEGESTEKRRRINWVFFVLFCFVSLALQKPHTTYTTRLILQFAFSLSVVFHIQFSADRA